MTRLGSAADVLRRAREAGVSRVIVGLSGGKDSLVTLDMAVAEFGRDNVECYFMYLVRGIRCVESYVDTAAARYKVPVHKVPHYMLGELYKHAVMMPPRRDARKWRKMKLTDIEQLVTERTGIDWFCYGHRMHDSLHRRAMLHKCSGLDTVGKRIYPLWEWVPRDVYGYMRWKKITQPVQFGGWNASGLGLEPSSLKLLRDRYPDDWARFLKVFPYAEASILRDEMKDAHEEELRRQEQEEAEAEAQEEGQVDAAGEERRAG